MNLYYLNRNGIVKSLPATEGRRKSVTPIFYESYKEALIALKDTLTDRINADLRKCIDIEKEIAKI